MEKNGHHNGNGTAPESDDGSRGRGLSEPILQDEKRTRQDLRLVARAAKWRWKMPEQKRDELVDRMFEVVGKRAVMVPVKGGKLEAADGPADANAIAAARVLVSMMGQNQADDFADEGIGGQQVNVNVGVQVVESDDWYGTRATPHGHIAEGNGASANGAALPGPVQGGSLRPAVGQNGHRSDGHTEGPREPPGAATGGD